ncbi:MAG: gamma carbonic anhydrase family protein [Candidatus Thiodiazotropha weberae]|uniref:Gamma carbonic anhydrase family protein n=1 Tax=Candidatus Thiodiazotropha endoloripes TaxID=1818881 RepID=A0A1E2UN85_9GAMM|nr:gamma carbonic anhydrase family protein [Candidatus Thiodiazotropha endoloripes]MCG7898175.1 gamma carbonic anhydrase family protein [Candidatus Thiodiazotropha weberae]MCG7903133.1 gamma carbonic anhydrase family protein [Candidatus Thiodiazotropha weberae]MCG7915095.1 gamma carbonic anhydrase family protein [Candidatus Thiodiazotropha weberae]ODB84504.1 gamma carbonic anhydrase family protein [Candidatus Thiodiazotropha endoloripes]ODB91130.1 gamma carbonic anhydrase family protein [Candi
MTNIRPFESHQPQIADDAWIDETAVVIGNVNIASQASIWPMSVVRGDVHKIEIGARTNIQDGSIMHVSHDSYYLPGGRTLVIGEGVTVGHRVLLHGCEIADDCFIGMGSTILDGAVLQRGVMLGAGSLVPQGRTLEGGYLWLGRPARRVRVLTEKEREVIAYTAEHYVTLAQRHAG